MEDKHYHSVRLDEELCKGCTACLKHCPTEAIRIRDGKAAIDAKLCVGCGECIRVCPHHAKIAEYDKLEVLSQYEHTVALPAPSLYTQFSTLEDTSIVLNALLQMGFNDVYEVSSAAELVSDATRKFLLEHDDGDPWISSACPSVVRLITKRFPNLVERLIPIMPPVEVAARAALKAAQEKTGLSRDKIGIVFISPCPAKVTYMKRPIGIDKSEIDAVVAIKDVYQRLLPHMKAVAASAYEDRSSSGKIGVSWGARGGEATALLMNGYMAADGIDNVLNVLEDIEDRKFKRLKFVELNACPGGCVGGVLCVENPFVAEARLKNVRKNMPVSVSSLAEGQEKELVNNVDIPYDTVLALGSNMQESFKILTEASRLEKKLPGLDCGACGAPTCKALAQDIAMDLANENACVYVLRDKIHAISKDLANIREDLRLESDAEEKLSFIRESVHKLSKDFKTIDDGGNK